MHARTQVPTESQCTLLARASGSPHAFCLCAHTVWGASQRKVYDSMLAAWKEDVQRNKDIKAAEIEEDRRLKSSSGKGGKAKPAVARKTGAKQQGESRGRSTAIFFDLRKAANHPLLVRTRTQDSDLPELAKTLLRCGHYGDSATYELALKEVSGYSDWEIHCAASEYQKRLPQFIMSKEDIASSAKLQKVAELLPKLEAGGHRVLLFSQWTTMLDIIEVFLDQRGIIFLRLDGSTPVTTRQQLIDKYNTDTSIPIFLLSTRAGGLGINLTSADTVILHDLDFNPQNDRQAEDRCHRIGQTKPVSSPPRLQTHKQTPEVA